MSSQDELKKRAAQHAVQYIEDDSIVGVGTGSTVNYFIDALANEKHRIDSAISSSQATTERLKALGIPVLDANSVSNIDIYVDGADEFTAHRDLIKGGGAALTGEKILTAMSKRFICIVDASKQVDVLGQFPLPIEVIPMARSYVARELVKLHGDPEYREGVVTDYGNIILDIHNLNIIDPEQLSNTINQLPGVVTNGIFTGNCRADVLVIANESGIETIGA